MFFFHQGETADDYRASLGERLSQAIDKAPTKASAAEAAGVTVEQLNKWVKGSVKVPAEGLRALSAFVDVDFSWLVTGEGEMKRPPAQSMGGANRLPAHFDSPSDVTDLDQPGMIAIPRYDEVRPSAGHGSVATSELPTTRVAFERNWLIDLGVAAESAVILPAQGDSMEPTIMNGSPMLVDTSKKEVRNGFIYVFDIDGDLVVKRIERLPDGSFDLISDNSNRYPTRTLTRETVATMTVVGRVYAAVSKF